jgi:alkanesulfonate monooxygenase SsuD/methylene tetrahydromethanopterin reductase-like flavin-dependent oxidoreductase (luciferase family)
VLGADFEGHPMDVAIASTIRNLPQRPLPLPQLYDEFFDDFLLADELGYSHIWQPEHHFAKDQHNPSALPVLAALARQTRRIRLGTYVLLLAFHHPILLAEEAAMIDILSHGRLDLAIGAGPMEAECEVFDIPRSETFGRTYEALQIVQKCWTEEEFSHHGKYFHFDNVRMTTKPVQRPHPPLFMAAVGPQSAKRAATRGYGLAMALGPAHNTYLDALEGSGRSLDDVKLVSGPVAVHIAETTEQAWDEAEEGLHAWISFYGDRGSPMAAGLPPVGELRKSDFTFGGMPFFVGSVEKVKQRMREFFAEAPLDELCLAFHHPGMSAEASRRAITLFAEEVMPEARTWGDRTRRPEPPQHSAIGPKGLRH